MTRYYPGLAVTALVAIAAVWLAQHLGAPVMLVALVLGVMFHALQMDARCAPGVDAVSRVVLRFGVALLGARITFGEILALGWAPIAIVLVGTASTIFVGYVVARMLKLKGTLGVLSGGAVGICGASAAMALSTALPKDRDAERDTILVVVVVTGLSTLAMVTYPLLARLAGLDHTQAGVFLGGTIHDVAQVVGAGYSISPETGDVATYVKMLRVSFLAPVVLAVAFASTKLAASAGLGGDGEGKACVRLPAFLVGFVVLVTINSLGWIPKPQVDLLQVVSQGCLIAAIAALGLKTSFRDLVATGWRPLTLIVGETVWIGAVVLAGIYLLD